MSASKDRPPMKMLLQDMPMETTTSDLKPARNSTFSVSMSVRLDACPFSWGFLLYICFGTWWRVKVWQLAHFQLTAFQLGEKHAALS